jgi:NAD(P)H-flavin reductase
MIDADRLRRSWNLVANRGGDQVALRFYSYLFIMHPETRDLFSLSMSAQRDRLVSALGHTVAHVDQLDTLVPFLEQLGRDHRKFGVVPDHYGPVGQALLATLAEFHDESWTEELAQDWAAAFGVVSKVMIDAAAAVEQTPAWWEADVVNHDRRTLDIAVLTLLPRPRYGFRAGQSVTLECQLRPRVWRHYSPANAPRPDGTIELHVRQEPGGSVSTALVNSVRPGDLLKLGPPIGSRLTLDSAGQGDLLLLAGGTGLAPLKALVEAVSVEARLRRVTLVVGVRTEDDLYDQDALWALANKYDWLTVIPAVAQRAGQPGQPRTPARVALSQGDWRNHEVFVCGSDAMVTATVEELTSHGIARSQIHYEGFYGLGGDRYGIVDSGKDNRW